MDLQILDDALVHRLGLAGGIRRQEEKGDGFQVFNLGVGGAVVNDHGDFSFLSLEASVTKLQILIIPWFHNFIFHFSILLLLKHTLPN